MKKKLLAGALLAAALASAAAAAAIAGAASHQRGRRNVLQFVQKGEIASALSDGDVILRLGDGLWSRFFKDLSPNYRKFSHMGIVRIRDGAISVIHAEGLAIQGLDSVNEVSLGEFLGSALSVGVYRLLREDGAMVSDLALEYVGVPFDWQFDMADGSRLYCTELLYVVLRRVNPEIRLNAAWIRGLGRHVIPLDVVSQAEYFERIGHWGR